MKERDVIIKVEGVSKKFCKDLKRSLIYGFQDILKLGRGNTDNLRKDEFWAVSDVSFELRRGDCLGLIGHNGAGKSTLLKVLNGLISPDQGSVTINGRVGALIELGAGFNPILTGRENIYNNGAVLGFSKSEIQEKVQKIIDFSEIEEFIDMPVQNYSSGMKVRLGFAVAANLEPDLLLIDEVLAVGDVGFRIKCFNAIAELMKKTAIILVSHAMPQIARVSNSVLLIDHGKTQFHGDTGKGVEAYFDHFPNEEDTRISGTGIEFLEIAANVKKEQGSFAVKYGIEFILEFKIKPSNTYTHLILNLIIYDKELKAVASCSSGFMTVIANHDHSVKIKLDKFSLTPGNYTMDAVFSQMNSDGRLKARLVKYTGAVNVKVYGRDFITHAPFQIIGDWSIDDRTIDDSFIRIDD